MRRRADQRRGQATIEFAVLCLLVALLLLATLTAISRTGIVDLITVRLTGEQAPSPASKQALTDALSGRLGATSISGAQAWLAEDLGGERALQLVTETIVLGAARRHPDWFGNTVLRQLPGTTRTGLLIAEPFGETRVRVVTPDQEAVFAALRPQTGERVAAATTALAWDGVAALAEQLARPLGIAVSTVHLLVNATASDSPLPPGTRAEDIVLCRPVNIVIRGRDADQNRLPTEAWRIGIIRRGRLILDALTDDPRSCREPTAAQATAGPR